MNKGGEDIFIVKLNKEGKIVWKKLIGGSQDEVGHVITQTSDSGFVVTGRTNSAFGQANLAYDAANAANSLAQAAYNYANTITTGGSSGDYFPTEPYGFVSQGMIALVSDDTFIQGEFVGPFYDCSDNPITPEGFYLEKDLGYLT